MKPTTTFALLSSVFAVTEAVTGQLGDAAAIYTNPPYAAYEAVLPADNKLGIKGSVKAATDQGGAVIFEVNFSNLPTSGGPFMYHLHVDPVPQDGNCTKTLAHLDPYIRGEAEACDPSQPATCQVGDLSGKYGAIANTTTFSQVFVDPYATLIPGLGSFFGNRSFVLHFANKTRIGCANFISTGRTPPAPGTWPSNSTASPSPSSSSSSIAAPPAATASNAPVAIVLPNAPGYAGGANTGYQGPVVAPSSGNTGSLPNNGQSSTGPNQVDSSSRSQQSSTVYFQGGASSLSGGSSAALMAVVALAGVFAVAF